MMSMFFLKYFINLITAIKKGLRMSGVKEGEFILGIHEKTLLLIL